ncbi:hypothetical protein DBR22_04460 [Arthrobacter sp. HMWF013]|nr:hypothetical protein DBR22_04460 [Arthrobacter sp. HMWF013]
MHSAEKGFIVVVGDSGVGKSSLLGEVARDSRVGWITAPVTNLRSAPGQLHNSLIDQLAAILDVYLADRSAVDATLESLGGAARRLGAVGGKELARVVGTEILNLLKSRLGPEFGESIGNMIKDILQTGDESLRQRLASSSELGTVEIVLKFAEEIVKLTDCNLRIVLDRAERLSPGDKAILLDMAEMLPERVQVIVGLSTAAAENQTFPAQLAGNGAEIVEVLPLSLESIRAWLLDANVDAPSSEVFLRVTSGYPLFMVEAISGAQAGLRIENIQTAVAFQELMRTSWNQLSVHAKTAARKLAAFNECPPDDFIVQMLQVDQNAWSAVRDELLNRRIFIFDNENVAWFHDRRRDLLWRTIMNSSDRDEAASTATASLDSRLETLNYIPLWAAACLPELSQADPVRSKYVQIAKLNAASRDSMAVLFALLELMEPNRDNSGKFVQTPLLLSYAADVIGVRGDSVDALQELEEAGFAFTKSNESISITTALIPDKLTYAAILGRMTSEFGRWTIPSIASNLFQQHFQPLVSPFVAATYGIGSLSLTELAKAAHQAVEETRGDSPVHAEAALAVSARLGSRPFFAGIAFQTASDRDDAVERLTTSEVRIMEEPLTISSLHRLPTPRVRSHRIENVFHLLGLLDSEEQAPLVGAHFHLASAQRRVDALEAVRKILTETELAASDLLEARSVLVELSHAPSSIMEVRLSGNVARADLIDVPEYTFNPFEDPLFGFKLARDGIVLPGESIRGWSLNSYSEKSSRTHKPFTEVVEEVTKALEEFNKFQKVQRIPLDESYLESEITAHQHQCLADARTMLAAGIGEEETLLDAAAVAHHVVIYPSRELWGDSHGATCLRVRSATPAVTVTITDEPLTREDTLDFFGISAENESDRAILNRSQYAFASDLIAELLGYGSHDIRLVHPSDAEGNN